MKESQIIKLLASILLVVVTIYASNMALIPIISSILEINVYWKSGLLLAASAFVFLVVSFVLALCVGLIAKIEIESKLLFAMLCFAEFVFFITLVLQILTVSIFLDSLGGATGVFLATLFFTKKPTTADTHQSHAA